MNKKVLETYAKKHWRYILSFSIILLISNVISFLLYFNGIENSKNEAIDTPSVSSADKTNNPEEESNEILNCNSLELKSRVEGSINISDSKIELIVPEDKNDNGEIVEKCSFDFTADLIKALKIEKNEIKDIDRIVLLDDLKVAFNFRNTIYEYGLLSKKTKGIITKEMFKGSEIYNKEIEKVQIAGPYLIPFIQDSTIYFFTDLSFGCMEQNDSYCIKMKGMYDELKAKNLLGIFEYNYKTGERVFLK